MDSSGILEKALSGDRITIKEGSYLYENAPLTELGAAAQSLRNARWDPKTVTFVIDRNINYTNICNVDCKFCAFYRKPTAPDTYTLTKEHVLKKVGELVALGGTQVLLQGGLNPKIKWEYYIELLEAISDAFPTVDIHSFSPTEIEFFAKYYHKTIRQVLEELRDAGLKSLPGGGAEILVDRVRQLVSPHKITAKGWLNVMEEAAKLGMRTTATMTYGFFETIDERMEHFDVLRQLQDKYGSFTAFIPWSMQPEQTELEGQFEKSTATDYLRTIALSRIMMDNFASIQAGWVTEGTKSAQMALHFGANDFGGILMEENVVSATGVTFWTDLEEVLRLIKEAGFVPSQRNTYYKILKRYDTYERPELKKNALMVLR
ncbi:MAG: dehypoxanthine futalosine cyclase [Candidatus Aenigmarchaeota archaeon]|nr:dehypoxanthine futalosine cyclase [Candidatus Aenigmarchaeota archaeon]